MIRLTIARHAKSDGSDSVQADHDRPLNARGRHDAPLMAERLSDAGKSLGVATYTSYDRFLEHDMDAVFALADRITVLVYGRAIATGSPEPVNYDAIPRVTYTHPEVAEVGITEAQASERGIEIVATKHAFTGVGRAIIQGQNQGHVKVLTVKDGPIVGASVVGPQAGEMIHELMYSVGWEALPSEAAAFIYAHPTLSEAIGETLMSAAGKSLH